MKKKSYYKSIGDIGMSNTFKILMNSLFGVMMTRVEKFKNLKIVNILFEKKSYYKSIGDIGMSNTFKMLLNSLFGVMMTRVEKFKNFKIVTNENQVDKQVKKPNFNSRNIINQNLAILEMKKLSVTYSYPTLIATIILQNSKAHMYNYLYKIYPKLFGDDYKVLYMDTDSIHAKLNMTHERYIEILENNKDLFGKHIGQIEAEYLKNPI